MSEMVQSELNSDPLNAHIKELLRFVFSLESISYFAILIIGPAFCRREDMASIKEPISTLNC